VSVTKLTKRLIETVKKLDDIVVQLEEAGVNVGFFHHRGEFGRFTENKSDRISLACVLECHTLYDTKSKTNNIEESTDDQTTKA
jgi:hypothetical protein